VKKALPEGAISHYIILYFMITYFLLKVKIFITFCSTFFTKVHKMQPKIAFCATRENVNEKWHAYLPSFVIGNFISACRVATPYSIKKEQIP